MTPERFAELNAKSELSGDEVPEVMERISALEEALIFYSDPNNYDQFGVIHNDPKDCSCGMRHHHPDMGRTATKALKG